MTLAEQVQSLTSLEEFFELFEVEYNAELITHGRVKLASLFKRNLTQFPEPILWEQYQAALSKAYCLLQSGVSVPLSASACASCKSKCD